MSGIAGLFYPALAKPIDPARIVAMSDVQAHRGPDGSGVWCVAGVGLGHRRLAIIDAEGGAQPMALPDHSLAVTFDGTICNFRELRTDLEARGARFRTESDTEVLLHGWRAWGPDLLTRLNGMFAFALYDAARQSLFLARDRFGGKPLHYAELADGAVAFASELKGLLAHPLLRRVADFHAVEAYLGLGHVPDGACIVAGVRKLPAGHSLLLQRGRPVPPPLRWWDLDFTRRATGRTRDLKAELVDRMRMAVRAHMVADVPPGAFLSGGVEGAAVVALMAERSKAAVQTCTIGVDAPLRDDASPAGRVAQRFATSHVAGRLGEAAYGLIDPLVAAFDEPFGDPAALPAYRLCQLARERMAVVLAGDGADEAMAGDRRHYSFAAGELVRGLLPADLRQRVFGQLGALYPDADWVPRPLRARATLRALAENGPEAYARAIAVTGPALRDQLYTPAARAALAGQRAEARYVETMRNAPARDALDRAQYADFRHRLPGDILTRIDRTSMAVGLEVRAPMLDHRLVEFEASLPPSLRIRGRQGKWLMKKALEPWLPRDILYRPGAAPLPPISSWFRQVLADEAAALASSPLLLQSGWFEPRAIARLAEDHRAGRAEHGRTLWQLVMLERSLARLLG